MSRPGTSWVSSTAGLPGTLLCIVCVVLCGQIGRGQPSSVFSGDVAGGWKVFTQKHCIKCHAIWDLGGKIGPDLGRSGGPRLTTSDLATTLWNHIPRMHSHMEQKRVSYPTLSVEEVSDLFDFLLFIRHLEQPGDPAEGQRIFGEKGCARCHSATDGPEVARELSLRNWATYSNPIVWAQKMWEHAPAMEQAMRESGITWPQLDDTDLGDIIAFARSLGARQSTTYLRPGSVDEGRRLFSAKGCLGCHVRGGPGKDLRTADLPQTLTGLASRMWNHLPEMIGNTQVQQGSRQSLTPQEMADVVAYVLSLRNSGQGGDPLRGRQVFVARRCSKCHSEEETADAATPTLEKLTSAITPVRFAQVIWNHGVPMRDVMFEAGSSWPLFQRGEVADLLAYLRSLGGESLAPEPSVVEPAVGLGVTQPTPPPVVAVTPVAPSIRPGESCASNTCHPNVLARRHVHTPTAQGECAACHTVVDPQRHVFTLGDSTSRLCYRCHDTAVDSKHIHDPVSVAVCTACHDPHSSDAPYGPSFTGKERCFVDTLDTSFPLTVLIGRAPSSAAGLSQPEAGTTTETLSLPITTASVATLEPFVTPDLIPQPRQMELPSAPPPASVDGGCTSAGCHVETVSGPVLHVPVTQQQCDLCHRMVDETAHRFEFTAKEPFLCYQCHDEERDRGEFIHGPLGLGLCTPCHLPHGGPHERLLPEAGSQLCFMCHSEMDNHVQQSRVQHKAISEDPRGCLSCHDSHRSQHQFQLRNETPELCYECHEETRSAILAATVSHRSLLESERSCDNCHDVHGSSVERILVDTEVNLCLGCHDRPIDTPNGTIVDMKSWIAANPEHHGPIREGLCTACHLAHGSENFRMLRHKFPREFYRPFTVDTYALCFECHEAEIVLDPRTEALTAFRNGDKNLHYVHVNQEKGRTCRACHEVHAGTQPKRMKDFVPFGQWKYPLGFEATADGGRCASGCHALRAYSRDHEIIQK